MGRAYFSVEAEPQHYRARQHHLDQPFVVNAAAMTSSRLSQRGTISTKSARAKFAPSVSALLAQFFETAVRDHRLEDRAHADLSCGTAPQERRWRELAVRQAQHPASRG
jgi:hypothetical protein